jgi:Integrase zinc binding domain
MVNVLSRLCTEINTLTIDEKTTMNIRQKIKKHNDQDLYTFHVLDDNEVHVSATLLQLNEKFKQKIIQKYSNNIHFDSILKIITSYKEEFSISHIADVKITTLKNDTTPKNATPTTDMIERPRSLYKLTKDSLLFYKDSIDQRYRLCLSRNMLKKIFHLTHDRENHYDVSKIYSRLITRYFVFSLLCQVKRYIAYCPKCQVNKILWHKSHEVTQSIKSKATSLHILTLDFILTLSFFKKFAHEDETFDSIMTTTNKFTKRVRLVSEKATYTVSDWTQVYWQHIYPDWGFSQALISDRDPKFLSEFWKQLFEKTETKLLISTAYHSQINRQSEKINQIVKIALRYYVSLHQDNWVNQLKIIQVVIKTATSTATKHSSF